MSETNALMLVVVICGILGGLFGLVMSLLGAPIWVTFVCSLAIGWYWAGKVYDAVH